MKKKTPFPMTPFDMLVVPEQLHMMKLFLPYLPSGTQKMLALWIKCQELTNTIAYFRDYPRIGMGECTSPKQVNAIELFEELRPYMKEDEADQIDMALSALSMMEMMQSPESSSGHPEPSDFLKSMMPSGTGEMFDLYSQIFEKGGDAEHESEGEPMGPMDEQSGFPESGSPETGTDEDGI